MINELDDITSDGKPNAPYRTLAIGETGVGKSTFFSKCKGVYFLPTEEGVNEIQVPQYKHKIDSIKLLREIIYKLRDKQHPYTSICLDNIKDTETLIIKAIEERLKTNTNPKSPKTIQDMNDDYGAGYQAVASEWKLLLNDFDELRTKRNINIFLTGHTKTEKVHNLEGKDYEKVTVDLIGQGSTKAITGWCDHVLYMRQDVSVTPDGKHKVTALKGPLSIYTRGTATYKAKTRGAIPWPERLPLDWDTFEKLRFHIATYGKGIALHLVERFEKTVNRIPTEKRDDAKRAFEKFISNEQWHLSIAVCEQAESE